MEEVINTFKQYDESSRWPQLFMKLKLDSQTNNRDLSISEARLVQFRSRNRYSDISPYNHTRVKLQRDDIDYINASVLEIDSNEFGFERKYILTQGPLPNTISHFWLMVFEQNSSAVIMLNKCKERSVQKCEEYFPTDNNPSIVLDDVDLQISFQEERCYETYNIKKLILKDLRSKDSERVITHFHYLAWPDFGVPETPQHFLRFLGKLISTSSITIPNKPAIIHCSAGVGRTGTLCLIDICLETLKHMKESDPPLDVFSLLHLIRRYRPGLIQAHEQLRFVFAALVESQICNALNEEDQEISRKEIKPIHDENNGSHLDKVDAVQSRRKKLLEKIDFMKKNQMKHSIKPREKYFKKLVIGGVVVAVGAILYSLYAGDFNK